MPVTEALELRSRMDASLERGPDALIVNGLYPELAVPARQLSDRNRQVALWRSRRALNDRELARLDADWRGPRWELPLLPLSAGPELVAELGGWLGRPAVGKGRGR